MLTKSGFIFTCGPHAIAVLLSLVSGAVLTLSPTLYLVPASIAGVIAVVMFLRALTESLGKLRLLAVLSVALLSGFAGTFSDTICVQIINGLIRWVAPYLLTLVALYNIAVLPRSVYWQNRVWRAVSIPLSLFILFAVLSVFYSPYPYVTLGRSLSFLMITLGTAVALIPVLCSSSDIENLARAVAALMAILVLFGVPLIFFPGGVGWLGGRYRSSWGNPVALAHISALLVPLYIWMVADQRLPRKWRSGAGVVTICLVLNIVLSQSRSGAIALVFALSVVILTTLTLKTKLVISIVLLAFLGLVLVVEGGTVLQDFITHGRDFDDSDITSGRAIVWQAAFISWQRSPLIGYGFGTGGDPAINSSLLSATGVTRSFSLYLELLATGGATGFLLLMWVFLGVLHALASGLYRVKGDNARFISMVMSIFVCGIVLNSTETWIISAGSAFASYWWLMLFLGIRMLDISQLRESGSVREMY